MSITYPEKHNKDATTTMNKANVGKTNSQILHEINKTSSISHFATNNTPNKVKHIPTPAGYEINNNSATWEVRHKN